MTLGRLQLLSATALFLVLSPFAARADSCTAIPDNGPLPSYLAVGSSFSGPVVEVIDGDSLCVAVGPRTGVDWVEVRLADFYAPEFTSPTGPAARAALEQIASGNQATCIASMRTFDRIAARCRIGGQAIGDLMRVAGVREGGAGTSQTILDTPRPSPPSAHSLAPSGLTCPELRARGGARRGEAGYRPEWDGDNDGIACEPYRR